MSKPIPPKTSVLTTRQKEIYDFLKDKITTRGYGPTVREIGTEFGILSPNGVVCHLKALEKKGLISRQPGIKRAIQLTEPPQPQAALPLIGHISAGQPLQRLPEPTTRIEFTGLFASRSHCCVRVVGHGLLDDHIAEGDYLAIRRQRSCRDGELVLVTVDGAGVAVKRYYRESRRVRLESVNRNQPSTFARNVKVIGLVVGVIRQF